MSKITIPIAVSLPLMICQIELLKYWNYSVRKESSPSQIISANREIGLVTINTSMNTVQCTSRETEDWISMYKFKNWIWFGIGWQKLLKNPYTNWICKRKGLRNFTCHNDCSKSNSLMHLTWDRRLNNHFRAPSGAMSMLQIRGHVRLEIQKKELARLSALGAGRVQNSK
jgi:hypothetical protein